MTIHFYLVPRLRMHGAVYLLLRAFMVCTGRVVLYSDDFRQNTRSKIKTATILLVCDQPKSPHSFANTTGLPRFETSPTDLPSLSSLSCQINPSCMLPKIMSMTLGNIKVKFTIEQTTKAQRGRGMAVRFL